MKSLIKLFTIAGAAFLVSVALCSFPVITAVAQEKAESPAREEEISQKEKPSDAYKLETITVTTDKREQNIQEVPAPIMAFTETDLEDAGIEDIDDVINLVPNMTFGTNEAVFRGIRLSQFTFKNPVVIYIDGVPHDGCYSFDADLSNVERVEVLRGPQGALYGKNAIGGIINVISKKPGNTYETMARGELAENETYGLKAYVNGPIVKDKLFFGLSGSWHETRGFMKNDHPDKDYFDGEEVSRTKILLRWLPTDRLEVNLHAGINQIQTDSRAVICSQDVRYHDYRDPDDKWDSDIFNSAFNLVYTWEDVEFRSITTYSDSEVDLEQNYNYYRDKTSWIGFHITDNRTFTQEFRFQSTDKDNGLKWLGGIYYLQERNNRDESGCILNSEARLGYNTKVNYPGNTDGETVSAFGQVTIPLTERLDLTAGLRYERIHKELDYGYEEIRADTGELLQLVTYNIDDDWDAFLPKGIFSWTITEDAMIYASVAKGYLAGGLNAYENNKDNAKFDEQTVIDYEIGAKTTWLDNKLLFNATLFYMDIKDMHVYSSPSPYVWVASNAARAHSQGIEIDARIRPMQGLDITTQFGWIDAEYDDYKNFTGKIPQRTPEYTLNFAVQYRHDSGLFVRGDIHGGGKTYYNDDNTISQDPYEIYNAKIGYEDSNWDVYFYGKNLFDKEYFSYGRDSGIGARKTVGAPRTFGVIASIRF